MDSMFLTDEELTELTGCRTHWAQARRMITNDIPHKLRPHGSLVVLRSAYQAAMANKAPLSPFPDIVEIMRMERFPRSLCGVYFLWRMGKVVYVGMSRNVLARIAQHLRSDKEFDGISLIESSLDTLKDLEAEMIARFDPIYNVTGKPERMFEVCNE